MFDDTVEVCKETILSFLKNSFIFKYFKYDWHKNCT